LIEEEKKKIRIQENIILRKMVSKLFSLRKRSFSKQVIKQHISIKKINKNSKKRYSPVFVKKRKNLMRKLWIKIKKIYINRKFLFERIKKFKKNKKG
jgi:hypothetical protein